MESVWLPSGVRARVPGALLQDVTCWALAPGPGPAPVLALGTRGGELLELARGAVCASLQLPRALVPRDLRALRTARGERCYLLLARDRLYAVRAVGPGLQLARVLERVRRYAVEDPRCTGVPLLRIWSDDDALPITLNDNFENVTDTSAGRPDESQHGSRLASSLNAKLSEARYAVAATEKRYENLLRFRQSASHSIFEEMCPNAYDDVFKGSEKVHEALSADNSTPWINLCNSKVVLGITVSNDTARLIFTDIKLILQSNTEAPVTYTTEIYENTLTPPYWQKKFRNDLKPKSKATIIAITDIEEFTEDNNIQYSSVIVYKMDGNEKFLPLQGVALNCIDTMKESFDVLSSKNLDQWAFLSILGTTINLQLRILQVAEQPLLPYLFTEHLNMDSVGNVDNILVHRTSPHHVLSGVMLIFHGHERVSDNVVNTVSVYLRNQSQLSSLLHLIYDGIPHRLVITNPETLIKDKLTSKVLSNKTDDSQYSMEIDDFLTTSPDDEKVDRISEFGRSLSIQMSTVLQHFDECIVAMGTSKNSDVVNLLGSKIDILSAGQEKYEAFVSKLNDEIRRGIKLLN